MALRAAALIALALAVLFGIALLRFDPNRHKSALIALVHDKTGRTLSIEGSIRLKLWPHVAVEVDGLTLSERAPEQVFGRVGRVAASIALWPLLRDEIVLGRIELAGAAVRLRRYVDGRDNFSDLLPGGRSGPAPDYDIAGIKIADATVEYFDEGSREHAELNAESLDIDRLEPDRPAHIEGKLRLRSARAAADVRVAVRGALAIARDGSRISFSGGRIDATGHVADVAFEDAVLETALAVEPRSGHAELSSSTLHVGLPRGTARADLDARIDRAEWRASAATAKSVSLRLVIKAGDSRREVAVETPLLTGPLGALVAAPLRVRGFGKDGGVDWRAGAEGRAEADLGSKRLRMDDLGLSGSVERGATRLQIKGTARLDLDEKAAALDGIDLAVGGTLGGATVSAQGRGRVDADFGTSVTRVSDIDVQTRIADAARSADLGLVGTVALDTRTSTLRDGSFTLRGAGATASDTATWQLSARLESDAGLAHLSLDDVRVTGEVAGRRAAGALKLALRGTLRAEPAARAATLSLQGTLDGSRFDGTLQATEAGMLRVAAKADRLDLARWTSLAGTTSTRQTPAGPVALFDPAALKSLPIEGHIEVGVLELGDTTLRRARIDLGSSAQPAAAQPAAAKPPGGAR